MDKFEITTKNDDDQEGSENINNKECTNLEIELENKINISPEPELEKGEGQIKKDLKNKTSKATDTKKNILKKEKVTSEPYIIECPHCKIYILIERHSVNCGIFRCGVYRNTGLSISPHMPQKKCEYLFNMKKIYGCGKPFKFNGKEVKICEYI